MILLSTKDVCFPSEAPEGRHMIAQGKAAQRPQPWVTIPINTFLFSSFATPGRRMMKKKSVSHASKRTFSLFLQICPDSFL
jgi:hypothetical protein